MEQIKPMTAEEKLLNIASIQYPIGSVFKSAYSGSIGISSGKFTVNKDNNGIVDMIETEGLAIYNEGEWAELSEDEYVKSLQAEIDRLKNENEELKEYLSKSLDIIVSEGSSRHDWLRGKIKSLIGK